MMVLGQSIYSLDGLPHKMAGVLPFSSRKGKLDVGYRYLTGKNNSLLVNKGQHLMGHEFHRWQLITDNQRNNSVNKNISGEKPFDMKPLWTSRSSSSSSQDEGWSEKLFHASWIHLHWPSSSGIPLKLRKILDDLTLSK